MVQGSGREYFVGAGNVGFGLVLSSTQPHLLSKAQVQLIQSPDIILGHMGRKFLVFTLVVGFAAMAQAQTVTLTVLQDLSSNLPTGTQFSARDSAGKLYHGHLVTHPARRLLRRGSMILVFDDPVVPVTKDREGIFRGGNKTRLLMLGASLAGAKLVDDAVDGAIGAAKARFVAAAVSSALIVFSKGSEAKLHHGDTVEVEPTGRAASDAARQPGNSPVSAAGPGFR